MRNCKKNCQQNTTSTQCSHWQPPMQIYSGSVENFRQSIAAIKQRQCDCQRRVAEARGLACTLRFGGFCPTRFMNT